jgi:hypothetical protein
MVVVYGGNCTHQWMPLETMGEARTPDSQWLLVYQGACPCSEGDMARCGTLCTYSKFTVNFTEVSEWSCASRQLVAPRAERRASHTDELNSMLTPKRLFSSLISDTVAPPSLKPLCQLGKSTAGRASGACQHAC